ncbi:MAG: hypothetical protein RJA81_1826, partial [Planctomycetota bacterium]
KDLIAGMRPFLMDERPVILAVSHVGGGGTERHVRDMAARLVQENVRTIYARPNLHGRLVFEERDANWNVRWRRAVGANSDKIAELLNRLKPNLAHIHHTMGVPERLFQELCKLEVPTDWTLHDYHCICPRIHLHDERGQYCNEPDTDACNRCLRQRGDYHERSVAVQIEKYREDWAGRLATARRIYVPSDDTNRRISRHFQHLRIETRPHMEPSWPEHAAAVPHVPGEPVRVAVIGSIGPIKGAYPLLDAARDAAQRNLPIEFVLVGTSSLEPQLLATGRVELTGPYYEHEIWDRLQGLSCHLAWLPSIWPETYMYTLSIAQMSSLWPVVYDLGAQAERILESGIGDSISLETPPDQMNDLFLKRACQLATQPLPQPLQYAQYPNFLEDYYGLTWQQLKLLGVQAMNEIPYEQNVGPFSHKPPQPHASRSDHARLHQHHSQLSS